LVGRSTDLWSASTALFSDESVVPEAFSHDSLSKAMSTGIIDAESYNVLRTVGQEKAHSYENLTDTLVLRSPFLSTKVQVPEISTLRNSEVLFGPQKDMYKNADLVLRERESRNLNKNTARHIIAMARIEQNLNDIGNKNKKR